MALTETDRRRCRAVRQVPSRGLRAWLRRYRRHRARVFHELDPTTGHWRRL